MVHNCAGKILVQENIAAVDSYVHLVHIFKRRLVIIYMSKLKNTQEMKYVRLTIKFNYFVLPASVGVSNVATQFHVSNSDGRMSKGVKLRNIVNDSS